MPIASLQASETADKADGVPPPFVPPTSAYAPAAPPHAASTGGFGAHAVVHMGMHGTVEWLPGSPLGNLGTSWPDVMLGDLPNL